MKALVYRFEDFELDVRNAELTQGGERVSLPRLSFRTLQVLLENAPNLVTFDELANQVWGASRVVTPENLLQRIKLVRRSLGDSAAEPRFVAVSRGSGVRFVGDVRRDQARNNAPVGDPEDLLSFYPLCSIAVLPFTEIGDDRPLEHVARSLSLEIVELLTEHRRFRVSAAAPDKTESATLSPSRIGQQLGVNYLLEGAVRRAKDRLRISLKLIRVVDESYVWAESMERPLDELGSIETEVAGKVDELVRVKMFVDVLQQNTELWQDAFETVDPAAVALYVQALQTRFANLLRGPYGTKHAMPLLEQAVSLDADFAAAHHCIVSYARQMHYSGDISLAAVREKIAASVEKLEALGQSVEPYIQGQVATVIALDFPAAEACFQEAARTRPELAAWVYYFLASIAVTEARVSDASRLIKRALSLAPRVAAEQSELYTSCAWLHIVCGNHAAADALLERTIAIQTDPNGLKAPLFMRAYASVARGDTAGLEQVLDAFSSPDGHRLPQALAFVVAALGDEARARSMLVERPSRPAALLPICLGWIAIGEKQRAIELLHEALEEHHALILTSLRFAAFWDPLREEPGFNDLLAELDRKITYTESFVAA